MATIVSEETQISAEGYITLPPHLCRKLGWKTGTKLTVEETAEGVMLRTAPLFTPTTVDDVFGSADYDGPPISIEQMSEAIAIEVRRRHALGRY